MDIHLAQLDPCPVRPQAVAATGRRRHAEGRPAAAQWRAERRSEEHTSELQSQSNLVCRLLLEKKKKKKKHQDTLIQQLNEEIKELYSNRKARYAQAKIQAAWSHANRMEKGYMLTIGRDELVSG